MSEHPEFKPPARAKFERRVKEDPKELQLSRAIRDKVRAGVDKARIDEVLERAAKEIEDL